MWAIYYVALILVFTVFPLLVAYRIVSLTGNVAVVMFVLLLIFLFLALLAVSIILAPFINVIYIKFAKNYQYSSDIFNIMTVIDFMKKTFKPVFIVAIQCALISIICNIIVYTLIAVIVFVFVIAADDSFISPHGRMLLEYLGMLFSSLILSYISGIMSFVFVDNVCDIYNEELKTAELEE